MVGAGEKFLLSISNFSMKWKGRPSTGSEAGGGELGHLRSTEQV